MLNNPGFSLPILAIERRSEMRRGEWPLVIFTLMMQMAVGLFILLVSFRFLTPESMNTELLDDLNFTSFVIIDALLIIGVLAASYHIDHPINARLAIANLKKSWLSREMLLGVSFGCIIAILSGMSWLEVHPSSISTFLLITGSVVGIALLYAIPRIYMLRTVPTWNSIIVPLSFFSTSLLLGSILFGNIFSFIFPYHHNASDLSQEIEGFLLWIEFGALGLMFIQVLFSYMMLKGFHSQTHLMDVSGESAWINNRLIFMLRMGFGIIGIALYINFMDQLIGSFHSQGSWGYLLLVSFLLIFLSELSGRILFYTSYKKVGF
jgi:anaerobic dimethyl sulfoxide reductase subunit C (anchor subunit)